MLCITSSSNNPFFNIAAEEFLLKKYVDNIFFLYRNEPSVIIGKHQNTLAEIDFNYLKSNGIKVVRRLSGGGAVYHDLGNLNFAFIRNGESGHLVDFKGFTKPIIDALAILGVNAKLEGHNSLMVNDKKVSGNAEHVFKNRVLHHGTLLFTSELEMLEKVLYVDNSRFDDKAVRSVRTSVANLSEMITRKMSIDDFAGFIMKHVMNYFPGSVYYDFSVSDSAQINELIERKYITWNWNFGYSPSYSLDREFETLDFGTVKIQLKVERGLIEHFEISNSKLTNSQVEAINSYFVGKQHNQNAFSDYDFPVGIDITLLTKVVELSF